MNRPEHEEVVGRIEEACCPEGTRLAPRSRQAMCWFLDLIDTADSTEEVNAYAEAIEVRGAQLYEPTPATER